MSGPSPADLRNFGDWKQWRPEYQQRALEMLREAENTSWKPFYCPTPTCDGNPHDKWEWQHARADQRPPKWTDPWVTLFFSGGRGSGKTRAGSEITHRVTKVVPRITLIGPTGPDIRETMVEGDSGLLATSRPGQRPQWESSKKKLTWPNGCVALGYSAEEPDRLRGPQHGFVWADEPAHYPQVAEVWSMMEFGLRLGEAPKIVATSTPKPTQWMKTLVADPQTVVHRVATYANLANLAPVFRDRILARYEGTRLGRQELHGELLEDVEGALWNYGIIQWVDEHPPLKRIVVAVDPAGTANKKSDETGIVVLAVGESGSYYVLEDRTGRYSPAQWASIANSLHDEHKADAIVAEKNYGADMVRHTLESSGYSGARIIEVQSRRGKELRAEPIVALYEKGKVFHVGERGALSSLEEEQTSWVPNKGPSPNRVDALVHGITELAKGVAPAEVAGTRDIVQRAPTSRHLYSVRGLY